MSSTLEERLKSNSSAFDGLLSLIPAKYYYDDDTQEQWKAKKKSKEELKQNKRAKLDPELSKESEKAGTAADVSKKRAKTAKPAVIPGQKLREMAEAAKAAAAVEAEAEDYDEEPEQEGSEGEEEKEKPQTNGKAQKKPEGKELVGNDSEEEINVIFDDEGNEIDMTTQDAHKLSTTLEPTVTKQKETTTEETMKAETKQQKKKNKVLTPEEKKQKEENLRKLKEKLESKISMMKEKRKAPGTKAVGAPSSREAILEERRKKAEAKAAKKRKLAELQQEDGSEDESDESDSEEKEKADPLLFQNIVFDENTKATSDLKHLRVHKKKGPAKKDIKGHLKLIEQKKQKLNDLDDDKKKELAEKDKWNRTLAQAEGQKLRDDEKLLKKALKRKEAQKRKSEIQWQERKDHVQDQIAAKAKRREDNLNIRKMNKGVKRKNQVKQMRKFKMKVAPKRPGFEGVRRSGKK